MSKIDGRIITNLSNDEIKEFGIFFTPPDIVNKCISTVNKYIDISKLNNILEPSCGEGAFIDQLLQFNENVNITCYELNPKVFHTVSTKYLTLENIKIINEDYLTSPTNETFDLIIGNPPYFVSKNKQYKEYYTGRANVFIQFIIHSLMKLKENGILCFVIPASFLNCQYYSKTRDYIKLNYTILNIFMNPSTFKTTKYSTITILIQKSRPTGNNNTKWFYNDVIMIDQPLLINSSNDSYYTIKQLMETDKTLSVSIGPFVWNQHKQQLKSIDSTDNLPVLIYKPNDISKRSLVVDAKPEIVNNSTVIIINRGCGNSKYKLSYELINPSDYPNGFILENHLLVIRSSNNETLAQIITSLNNSQTQSFINSYITNGAMNLNDLINNIRLFT